MYDAASGKTDAHLIAELRSRCDGTPAHRPSWIRLQFHTVFLSTETALRRHFDPCKLRFNTSSQRLLRLPRWLDHRYRTTRTEDDLPGFIRCWRFVSLCLPSRWPAKQEHENRTKSGRSSTGPCSFNIASRAIPVALAPKFWFWFHFSWSWQGCPHLAT